MQLLKKFLVISILLFSSVTIISMPALAATVSPDAKKSVLSMNSPININTASEQELMTLPGIGKKTATSIIEYKNNNGNFESIEDLIKVKGIGAKKLAKIKPFVTI